MNVTKESVISWLEETRRNRTWLAEKCNVSKQAVSNWLREKNSQGISASAKLVIQKLMEEDAAATQKKPPHSLVLEFEEAEYSSIEKAALANRQTIRQWAKDELNQLAQTEVESLAQQLQAKAPHLMPDTPNPAPKANGLGK